MAEFNRDQALAQHIKLSDLHEKEKQELIAAGRHSNVSTSLNLALGELDEEARRNGYVFRCWESDVTHGFIHTIEKINSEPLETLQKALEQQRTYERENWPFVGEGNKPTGTGESITYHLASLYCWSPAQVLSLSPEQRDERLKEIWRSFSIAGDIIHRYESAAMVLLKEESQAQEYQDTQKYIEHYYEGGE